MTKIESEIIKNEYGEWVLKNRLDFTDEELEIIGKSVTAAKESNRKDRERIKAVKREKVEKRKQKAEQRENKRSLWDYLFCEEG